MIAWHARNMRNFFWKRNFSGLKFWKESWAGTSHLPVGSWTTLEGQELGISCYHTCWKTPAGDKNPAERDSVRIVGHSSLRASGLLSPCPSSLLRKRKSAYAYVGQSVCFCLKLVLQAILQTRVNIFTPHSFQFKVSTNVTKLTNSKILTILLF